MSDENKRIEIDDLPRAAEDLTAEEAQCVTGGKGIGTPTGTVTFIVDGSSSTAKGNTIGGALADDPTRKMGDDSV